MRSDVSLVKYLANLGHRSRRELTALVVGRRETRADCSDMRDSDPWAPTDLRVDRMCR